MEKPQQNLFLDTILAKFATRIGIMDSIVNVIWDEQDKSALIHLRPLDPEQFSDLVELTANTLKEIDVIKFAAQFQKVDYRGSPSFVAKITDKS